MVKFPQISPKTRILGSIRSKIHDFKETSRIAGLKYALWKLQSNIRFTLSRSKDAGETVGRSMAEPVVRWIEKGSGIPAESIAECLGETIGFSKDGELLYPVTRQWD